MPTPDAEESGIPEEAKNFTVSPEPKRNHAVFEASRINDPELAERMARASNESHTAARAMQKKADEGYNQYSKVHDEELADPTLEAKKHLAHGEAREALGDTADHILYQAGLDSIEAGELRQSAAYKEHMVQKEADAVKANLRLQEQLKRLRGESGASQLNASESETGHVSGEETN